MQEEYIMCAYWNNYTLIEKATNGYQKEEKRDRQEKHWCIPPANGLKALLTAVWAVQKE